MPYEGKDLTCIVLNICGIFGLKMAKIDEFVLF